MRTSTLAPQIRDYVKRIYIEPARNRHVSTVEVVAGDIHRALRLENRVPAVCQVLKGHGFLEENRLEIEHIEGPPSGLGPRLKITYRLLDNGGNGGLEKTDDDLFERLKGISKETFASLGGGEAFLKRQRKYFYEPEPEEPEEKS